MKARTIHYNATTGIATAEPFPDGEKHTVAEDAVGLRLRAADEVEVRVDGDLTRIESLVPEPLLVRVTFDGTLEVKTARRVQADEAPKL